MSINKRLRTRQLALRMSKSRTLRRLKSPIQLLTSTKAPRKLEVLRKMMKNKMKKIKSKKN